MVQETKYSQQSLSEDIIRSLSHSDMLRLALEIDDPRELRRIAGLRFSVDAKMENNDPNEPFIRWPVINTDLQPWLPLFLAKVARAELAPRLNGDNPLLVAIPRSATPYMHPILDYQLFSNASAEWVLKEDQLPLYGIHARGFASLGVPSYVHGRSADGLRNMEHILFFHPQSYEGRTILLFDDALAEGLTAITVSRFLKTELGARQVLLASPMAKVIQRGEENIARSGLIDAVSVLVHVTEAHGFHQPIKFYSK